MIETGLLRDDDSTPLVLIGEDNEMGAQMLATALLDQGRRVEHAHDGFEALVRLKKTPLPDVVLLDMNMRRL